MDYKSITGFVLGVLGETVGQRWQMGKQSAEEKWELELILFTDKTFKYISEFFCMNFTVSVANKHQPKLPIIKSAFPSSIMA